MITLSVFTLASLEPYGLDKLTSVTENSKYLSIVVIPSPSIVIANITSEIDSDDSMLSVKC